MALSLSDLEKPANSSRQKNLSKVTTKTPVRPWSAETEEPQGLQGPQTEQVWSFSLRLWLRQKYQSSPGFYFPKLKIMR